MYNNITFCIQTKPFYIHTFFFANSIRANDASLQLTLIISNTWYLDLFGILHKCLGPLSIYYSSKTSKYSLPQMFHYLELILGPLDIFPLVISNFMNIKKRCSRWKKGTISKYFNRHFSLMSKFKMRFLLILHPNIHIT